MIHYHSLIPSPPSQPQASEEQWKAYEEKIRKASSQEALHSLEHELFGRKRGLMTLALRALQSVVKKERKRRGEELNTWKEGLLSSIAEQLQTLQRRSEKELVKEDRIDVTLELPSKPHGHLHPIPEFIRSVEEVFGRMGFDTAQGPEVETEEMNFDLLNFPKDHPARDTQDVFYIEDKGKRMVLRSHTSTVQIRYMRTHKPPFRMVCPGKAYRRDADATHSPMFHQFEGLMVGHDVSLANMKAVMIAAVRELIAPNVEFRFRTGYFPFVEPGLEMDMRWQGDVKDSREGEWLEIAGCGMVHPNVLSNCGIDPMKWQGFAFGFGVERLLMIKHQIKDIRLFTQGDLRFLKQF